MVPRSTRRRAVVVTLAALTATVAAATGGPVAAQAADASPPGTVTSVAGTTVGSRQYGFSGDGGPATSAQLYHPRALAFDGAGNAYVADTLNHRIRRIDTSGTIMTLAGNGTAGYAGDNGPAVEASLRQPHGVAVDSAGNLYIADSGNDRIRRVSPQGTITTIAGNGTPGATGDGGPASAAQVKDPKIMVMGTGDVLYIADTGNNRVRKIDLGDGRISTVAGVTKAGAAGDGGPAVKAQLNSPRGLWVTRGGVVYIADSDNHKVRKVGTDGIISTVAGTGTAGSSGDGGRAAKASLNGPRGIATDGAGNLYIGEEMGQRIRKVDRKGAISTLAGNGTAGFSGDGGPASQATFDSIRALAFDGRGSLWVADTFNNRVRMISSVAEAEPAAPSPEPSPSPEPAPATERTGYWMVDARGETYGFGDAKDLGDPAGQMAPDARAVDVERSPSRNGYLILDSAGIVYAFGDARSFGNLDPGELLNREKATSLSATPTGKGYWIFTNRGRAVSFGDADTFGDMTGVKLNGPVLDSVATPSGQGYYMVASDGGVFSFGDASFRGSMGDRRLNAAVQSLVPTADSAGYWLVAADGGVFSFGTAGFRGSMGGKPLNEPVVGMVRYGNGYLMVAADGGIFTFSDKAFAGSLGDRPPKSAVVSVAPIG